MKQCITKQWKASCTFCRAPFVLLACAVGSSPVVGQTGSPLVTDRPDFTESPVSVARGMVQFEGGYTFARVEGESNHSLGEVLVRLGIGGPLELRLGLNSYVIAGGSPDTQRGFEDSSIGVKLELGEGAGWVPTAGIIAALSLPTGGNAFSSNKAEPELILALGWELPSGWSLGSNAGFLAGDIDAGADNRWIGSAAIGRGLSTRVSAFFEGYGFAGGQGESDLFLDSGLTFALSEQLQLDFRVAKQIRGSLRESHVGIGVARRWNLLR